MPELETKLVPHVKLAPKVYVSCMTRLMGSDTIIKEGTMAILRDSQANRWDKCYFILKRYVPPSQRTLMDRPYLHIHPTYTERPIQIINLTKANITPSPDVEALLGVCPLSSY
jgi:kinesin family protein 1